MGTADVWRTAMALMDHRPLAAAAAHGKLVATEKRVLCMTYLRHSVAHKKDAGAQAVHAVGEVHICFELESGKGQI